MCIINSCLKSFVNFESVHRCKGFLYLTELITFKKSPQRQKSGGRVSWPLWGWFLSCCMKLYPVIKDFTDAVWGWLRSTFKTADSEKPTVFILSGSIREPLYFFLRCYPSYSKASVGARSSGIPWVAAGRGVWSQRKPHLVPLGVCGWRVLVALSVAAAERTSPGMAGGLSPTTRPHKQQSSSWAGWKRRRKESLLRTARRARHRKGGRTVSIRKLWSHTWC